MNNPLLLRRTIVLLALLASAIALRAQPVPPNGTGRITVETGAPLSGVTVTVRATGQRIVTNTLGEFSLALTTDSAQATASHVGYITRSFFIRRGRLVVVALQAISALLDTVRIQASTGYQEIPKERATGSFNVIGTKLFNEQPGTTVMERLEAIGSAVQVDRVTTASPGLTVRGISTIQGPRSVLVVLDNFPYEGSLDNINPNDVESITILKDAAAASIWGARAGNGVVVITTKKGKFNQPIKTEFSASATALDKPDLFWKPTLSSSDAIDIEQYFYDKGAYASLISAAAKTALSPVVNILLKKTNGTLTAAQAAAQLDALRGYDVRNDFNKYMYTEGAKQQYALNMSGGSKDMNWLFATGYDKNKSVLSAGYDRLNLRLTNTWRPAKKLQAGGGILFTTSKTSSGKPGYGDILPGQGLLPIYTRLADDAGNALPVMKTYNEAYLATAGNGKLLDWNYYPLTDWQHTPKRTNLEEITGNLNLNYKLFGWLAADVKYQYERQQADISALQDGDSYGARDLINKFSTINATTGVVTSRVPAGGILDLTKTTVNAHNLRGQLNVSRRWGDHDITAIAGGEVRNIIGQSNVTRYYGVDEFLNTTNVDNATSAATFVTGSATVPTTDQLTHTVNRFISTYANAAYTFRSRYTLSGSARRDASNLYGIASNDKWTPLWSAGAAWSVSEEGFYHVAALPYLKLRMTYGASGNTDPQRYAVTTLEYLVNSTYTGGPTAEIGAFPNTELKWERVKTLNVGVDFKLRNNRISGSLEWYHKHGIDLFGNDALDWTAGAGLTAVRNTASITGQGLDADVLTRNTTGLVKWDTRVNLSLNTDKVEQYSASTYQASAFVNSGSIKGVAGNSVYSMYAYQFAGLDPATGDPLVIYHGAASKDYAAVTGVNNTVFDIKYIGRALPPVFGSMGNTVAIGPLSLTATVVGKFGHYFLKDGLSYNNLLNRDVNIDYLQRWQKPGDELTTNVPSLAYPLNSKRDDVYRRTDIQFLKADFVRLQYVTAAWQLSREQWHALPVKTLDLQLNAANLGLLWKANKAGIDPDYSTMPPAKTYSLTLRTTL